MKTIVYCIIILFIFSCQKKQEISSPFSENTTNVIIPTEELTKEIVEKVEEANKPKTYFINDLSEQYSAIIIEDDTILRIVSKSENFEQTFTSTEFQMDIDSSLILGKDSIELFEENGSLIFDDFNFDWSEDIAIRNGSYGPYGGPTYDIYVYHTNKNKFVPSKELSQLTFENLGMFECNHEKEILTTFSKSGCCWHSTKDYAIRRNY